MWHLCDAFFVLICYYLSLVSYLFASVNFISLFCHLSVFNRHPSWMISFYSDWNLVCPITNQLSDLPCNYLSFFPKPWFSTSLNFVYMCSTSMLDVQCKDSLGLILSCVLHVYVVWYFVLPVCYVELLTWHSTIVVSLQ